jgi:hypothetical protein
LATIRGYFSNDRLTLGMKCEDLSPEQLVTRSVPPSTMSLLGLVRRMARVEYNWFQLSMHGHLGGDGGSHPTFMWGSSAASDAGMGTM